MSGRVAVFLAVGAATLAAAAGAGADGLPVLSVDAGPTGVTVPAGSARYVTIPAGHGTVVARVRRNGGRILRSRLLPGTFTIPAVAYDGSAGGLSADGRTLVLITPRTTFPRARTTLLVLGARGLSTRATIRLRGDFSFDAISPRGRLAYLIEYNNPRDPTRYLVRAYDLARGRPLHAPVVDPHERGEKMRGNPLSRAISPDGRWAYTLYDGAGGTPFVHALDTSGRTARCIDLDELAGDGGYLWRLRLGVSRNGRTLTIRDGKERELLVDTRTFKTSRPAATAAAAGTESDGLRWPVAALLALGAAVAAGVLLTLGVRRRAGRSPGAWRGRSA
jgi:hypothetical protein